MIARRRRGGTDTRHLAAKLVLGALFLAAVVSQAKLQTVERDHTIELGNKAKLYEFTQEEIAARGTIFSADGRALAKDERVYDLNVTFADCPRSDGFWLDLSKATGIPATEFSMMADSGARARLWPQSVAEDQKQEIDKVRSSWHAGGVSLISAGYRAYPLGDRAACLVGVIRRRALEVGPKDRRYQLAIAENGKPRPGAPAVADMVTGLEEAEDSILRGTNGERIGVADRSGNFLPMRSEEGQKVKKDGSDLTVTIDSGLQALASQEIKTAVESSKADCGVAVIEDPSNGNLLAVANYPTFSPYAADGSMASMGEHGGLNQAYMSCLEPGSMFKILTLGKALDEHVVSMNDTFYCPGEKEVVPGAKDIKCDLHHGNRAHGEIDPVMAIARSCNIWAATWAYKIGYDRFAEYLDQLGLLDKPVLGMPGEVTSLFNRNDPAKELQIANVGFGQSINCTPVGLVGAFSTLANQGVRMNPRLVERINGLDQAVAPGRRILSRTACDDVIKGMIAVMENPRGTGYALRIPGYEIAGKTGTAQKVGSRGQGHVSNFVGFVPARSPRAVILVMVNNPKTQYYGAEVAGPVFRDLAEEIIRKYHLPPTEPVRPSVASIPPTARSPKPYHQKAGGTTEDDA